MGLKARGCWSLLALLCGGLAAAQQPADPPRAAVEDKVKDRFIPAPLGQQQLGGLLGERIRANLENRLLRVDEEALLAGFQKRPGGNPRVGEHVGKFLDAASATWAYTKDQRLKAALDRVANALIATQLPDGYLGTYADTQRWTAWDVWVHKHVLAGLLSYYQVTEARPALEAARQLGDLLTRTFGSEPGRRDLIKSGAHQGLAATAILEPICALYRYTGEQRGLAEDILRAYDRPDGPRLIRSLARTGSVSRIADAKAYEILSNLVGLVDWYRLGGDDALFKALVAAWKDITSQRLYITGTTSSGEYFKEDFNLPGQESASVGEACVSVSWLELNWQLLRVTGEAQYGDEIERTVYNHLLGAQDPRDGSVFPFPPLVGRKRPERGLTCCVSSQPRGIALIPQMVWGVREGGLAVILYTPGEATVSLGAGAPEVAVTSQTRFPRDGAVTLTLRPSRRARFPVFLRVPAWCRKYSATAGGTATPGTPGQFLRLDRTWQPGDRIEIAMDLTVQALPGGKSYPDHLGIQRGPQVLALEAGVNPEVPFLHRAAVAAPDAVRLVDVSDKLPKSWTGTQGYALEGIATQRAMQGKQAVSRRDLLLVPFADARNYRVWLTKPDKMPFGPVAVTAFGTESWSRPGNLDGSICDERPDTFRVTIGGAPARQDWYAVEMDNPEAIGSVVYRHGRVFQNGGWFDTSSGKPAIQVKRTRTGNWETVATLDSYPVTSATVPPTLHDGQGFEVKLKQPVTAVAVRIVGRPGGAFSSCAELAAYGP